MLPILVFGAVAMVGAVGTAGTYFFYSAKRCDDSINFIKSIEQIQRKDKSGLYVTATDNTNKICTIKAMVAPKESQILNELHILGKIKNHPHKNVLQYLGSFETDYLITNRPKLEHTRAPVENYINLKFEYYSTTLETILGAIRKSVSPNLEDWLAYGILRIYIWEIY
jgi:serine/threonine protein kinase